ncbi:MAG: RNA-guided endonuclease TnpB family protein [Dehalococcoidales bacterium]|nr:RNA-guided endonuclease TnpB family protein [Dehalococcoidales bacterium]
MERFNEGCNYASGKAFETSTYGQFHLHHIVYGYLREHYGLSAQMAVRAIAQVSESYKVDRKVKHSFNPHSAMVYDQRILSWKGLDKVSILTLVGRQIVPTRIGAYQEARIDRKVRQSDLILRDGTFYLAVVVDAPEPTPNDPNGYLGIDLGIVNIAADSDGKTYSGNQINGLRKRQAKLRSKLQAKGTKAAKRLLVKRSHKERRFATNINHTIAKSIVAKAKDTGRGIALEDLSGIHDRITVRHSQRRQHHSWAFRQLRSFIEYKAILAGVVVKLVDPRNTSRTCPVCGCIDKRNRPSQSIFSCVSCGFSSPADTVAAGNISRRALVNEPCFSPALIGIG